MHFWHSTATGCLQPLRMALIVCSPLFQGPLFQAGGMGVTSSASYESHRVQYNGMHGAVVTFHQHHR